MHKLSERKNQGFTIIEVLIVLAIAGLILLVVFLAVPALQRNARNTTIKADAQNLLGGVSEYRGAKDGSTPGALSYTAGVIGYRETTSGPDITTMKIQGSTEVYTDKTTAPTTGWSETGKLWPVLRSKCNGDTAITASPRSVAVFYLVETANNPVQKCADG